MQKYIHKSSRPLKQHNTREAQTTSTSYSALYNILARSGVLLFLSEDSEITGVLICHFANFLSDSYENSLDL